MLRMFAITAALAASTFGAFAADDIVGRWRTQPGDTASISSCGGAYCITLKDGDYAGRRVGQFKETGEGRFVGSITNPEDGKTYNGQGTLSGDRLTMKGCVLGGLICKSQTWSRL